MPQTRGGSSSAAGAGTAAPAGGWGRSKILKREIRSARKGGLLPADESCCRLPGPEIYPSPPKGFRVMFLSFLFRGLSLPAHEFLRGLLFVYGVQLHQLTPNSILHIALFITLCECFLGIYPNWALWNRLYFMKRAPFKDSHNNVGGLIIGARGGSSFFDFQIKESIAGWWTKCFYIQDQKVGKQRWGLEPFAPEKHVVNHVSWKHQLTVAEIAETDPMMSRIKELVSTKGREVNGLQIMATWIRRRIQPVQARTKPMWTFLGMDDPMRVCREDMSTAEMESEIKHLTILSRDDVVVITNHVRPFSSTKALPEVINNLLVHLLSLAAISCSFCSRFFPLTYGRVIRRPTSLLHSLKMDSCLSWMRPRSWTIRTKN